MFKLVLICAFLFTLTRCEPRIPKHVKPFSQEMIDSINSLNTTWKAGHNFGGMPLKYVKRRLGEKNQSFRYKLPEKRRYSEVKVPDSFDARENWPHCKSIKEIHDQGGCKSYWAMAAVEAMNDRICIESKGELQIQLSVQDVISCFVDDGCERGFPGEAWNYWLSYGIVTGGDYNSISGCMPYLFAPCEHYVNGTRPPCSYKLTPPCVAKCSNGQIYIKDKNYAKIVYAISKDENKIKDELYNNGPVEAFFQVYSDFVSYKSGVYQRTSDELLGKHAVRILGWGVENKVPYWLVANSWNTDWGEKGFFKISRGKNECGIEDNIFAGKPKIIK